MECFSVSIRFKPSFNVRQEVIQLVHPTVEERVKRLVNESVSRRCDIRTGKYMYVSRKDTQVTWLAVCVVYALHHHLILFLIQAGKGEVICCTFPDERQSGRQMRTSKCSSCCTLLSQNPVSFRISISLQTKTPHKHTERQMPVCKDRSQWHHLW